MGRRFGYARVSSKGQNLDRQLESLKEYNVIYVYADKVSGANAEREDLSKLLGILSEGDVVYVHSLDRLARSLPDLLNIIKDINSSGAELFSIKENLRFTTSSDPVSRLYMTIMGAVAEFERELIRERQREGIELAKATGKYTGRKSKLSDAKVAELHRDFASGLPRSLLISKYGISRVTLLRYLKMAESKDHSTSAGS